VEATSRKRFINRYPALLFDTTTFHSFSSWWCRQPSGNRYTSRPLFITSCRASLSSFGLYLTTNISQDTMNRNYYCIFQTEPLMMGKWLPARIITK
jgi:hypothetical protein